MSPCWAEGTVSPAHSGWVRLLWLLGCWSLSPCSALALSAHPGSRNQAGAGRSSAAAATCWAGVVLLPLLSRQLITREPLMLVLCCPRAKDKHCYYVREWRGGEIKFLDFPCSWWVGNLGSFPHSEHVWGGSTRFITRIVSIFLRVKALCFLLGLSIQKMVV